MKTTKIISLLMIVAIFFATGCSEDNNDQTDAPTLPPMESLTPNFSAFIDNNPEAQAQLKSTSASQYKINFAVAYITVAAWNTILYKTLVIPVTAYEYSFSNVPVKVNENIWMWSYNLGGLYADYSAKLTGEVIEGKVKWQMKITYDSAEGYAEFLWFEGTSNNDGSGGTWTMYHSYEHPEELLTLSWTATNDEIKNTTYTYVLEEDVDGNLEPFYGSYLEYGFNTESDLYFYNIHSFDEEEQGFVDVKIELNKSDKSGRIQATNWQENTWHCWDSSFEDAVCN